MESKKFEREVDTIILCYCGSSEDPHNFRHIFDPRIFIDKCENEGGEFYRIDAADFEGKTVDGRCTIPQCTAGKSLHGPVIKHVFSPSESFTVRAINLTLPLDTLCRVCKEKLEDHTSMTHAFTTKIVVENKTEHDTLTVKGKTYDQTIVLEKEPLVEPLVDESG